MIDLLIKDQMIQVVARGSKDWYTSKGYKPEGYKPFWVRAEDLPHSSRAKIKVVCDYCGKEYVTTYRTMIKGRKKISKDCCKCCTAKKRLELSPPTVSENGWQRVMEACAAHGYSIITTKDNYMGVESKVEYMCPQHGVQSALAENILSGHGCRKCSDIANGNKCRKDIKYIISTIESRNGNRLLNPEEYKGVRYTNLKIKCGCGNEYITSFSSYKNKHVDRCPVCTKSRSYYENKICIILDSMSINYTSEKAFHGCVDKGPLFFDFYLPSYNLCIEYDGEQHYDDYYYRNKTDDPAQALADTQRRDEIKNQYCKNNGIDLLRIPYWNRNRIKEIIENKISQIEYKI